MTNHITYQAKISEKTSVMTNLKSSGIQPGADLSKSSQGNSKNLKQYSLLKRLSDLNLYLEKKLMEINSDEVQIQENSILLARWMRIKLEHLISINSENKSFNRNKFK